jgi:hypothetical protein
MTWIKISNREYRSGNTKWTQDGKKQKTKTQHNMQAFLYLGLL